MGKRLILAAVSALLAAQPVMAATTYLCVEEVSTGLDWRDGRWTPVNYYPQQHVIKRLDADDELASVCLKMMADEGRNAGRIVDAESPVLSDQWACYSQINVGDTATYMDTSLCKELYFKDALDSVRCDDGLFANYKFEPAGEFLITRTTAAPVTQDNPAVARDSLSLSVGKCSVIAP